MTKQIDIKQLIPFMKDGWVAMDNDGDWYWHEEEPFTEYEEELNRGCWYNDGQFHSLKAFNIAPVEDWTKSLIRIDESQNNLCITDELENKDE